MQKVLLIAHEFSPYIGSECEGGWRLCQSIAERSPNVEYILVCAGGNQFNINLYRKNISEYLKISVLPKNLKIEFIDYSSVLSYFSLINIKVFGRIGPIGFAPLFFLTYKLWQAKAFSYILKKYGKNYFDVVHMINLINAGQPGPWWKLDAKLIWGPTGGLLAPPKNKRSASELFRSIALTIAKSSKDYKNFCEKAKHVFIFDESSIPVRSLSRMPDFGVDLGALDQFQKTNFKPLKIYFAGQLNRRKGFDTFLRVVDNFKDNSSFHFYSFGKGPLEHLTSSVSNSFYKHEGAVPREILLKRISELNILIIVSYREAASSILLESLSRNKVIISTDVGAISLLVHDEMLVKYSNEKQICTDIILILKKLSSDGTFYKRIQKEQHEKASKFTYDAMTSTIINQYEN